MPVKHDYSWKEIILPQDFEVIHWFYSNILPEAAKLVGSAFQEKKWQVLYENWDCQEWLSLYEKPLSVVSKMNEQVLGSTIPTDDLTPEMARDSFIQAFRSLKQIIDSKAEQADFKDVVAYLNTVLIRFRLELFVGMNHIICPLLFGEPVGVFIERVRKGDTEAMVNLVKLDKSFLQFEPIAKRIRYATLSNEYWFLDKVGKAMEFRVYEIDFSKRVDDMMLWILWHIGFCKATLKVFNEFLWDLGITKYDNEKSLGKHLERIGLTKYSRDSQE